jgi:hypothetical protein
METTSFGNFVEIKDQKIELEGAALIHLNEIRKWTQFLSILGFVATGFLLFAGILLLVTSSLRSLVQFDQLSILSPWIGIIYIVFAGIYFFPVLYLYRFSKLAKHSLMQISSGGPSNELMAQAIDYMKKHFRFVGIMTIIILAVYLMAAIGVLIAFAMKT